MAQRDEDRWKRNRLIFEAVCGGMSQAAASRQFGLSREHVRVVCFVGNLGPCPRHRDYFGPRIERIGAELLDETLIDTLSFPVRTLNALLNHGCTTVGDVRQALQDGSLSRAHNVGRVTLAEVAKLVGKV